MSKKYADLNVLTIFWNRIKAYMDNKVKTTVTKINTSSVISKNTNYTVPQYTLGNNSLSVFFESCKLIKDIHYKEISATVIQFIDWDVPANSNLEIIIRK